MTMKALKSSNFYAEATSVKDGQAAVDGISTMPAYDAY